MAELFQRDRSVIGKHFRNIFKEGELDKNSVWQNLPTLLLIPEGVEAPPREIVAQLR